VQLIGLSPDSVSVLKEFTKQKKINFPLLSDPEGKTIKSLGVQNEASKKLLPHPGILIIGQDGTVREKLFKEGHRARHDNPTILAAVESSLEPVPAN
jgi:peroxiredoxin